jgi:hypothetical protein
MFYWKREKKNKQTSKHADREVKKEGNKFSINQQITILGNYIKKTFYFFHIIAREVSCNVKTNSQERRRKKNFQLVHSYKIIHESHYFTVPYSSSQRDVPFLFFSLFSISLFYCLGKKSQNKTRKTEEHYTSPSTKNKNVSLTLLMNNKK